MTAFENVYFDTHPNWGEHSLLDYGRQLGYTEVGVCGVDNRRSLVLFELIPFDVAIVRGSNAKSGERIFRYVSGSTVAANIMPLCAIDSGLGYLYSLSQRSSDGLSEQVRFDRRPTKLAFIRYLTNFN